MSTSDCLWRIVFDNKVIRQIEIIVSVVIIKDNKKQACNYNVTPKALLKNVDINVLQRNWLHEHIDSIYLYQLLSIVLDLGQKAQNGFQSFFSESSSDAKPNGTKSLFAFTSYGDSDG